MGRVMLVGLQKRDGGRIASYFKRVGVDCDEFPTLENAIEKIPVNPPSLVITNRPASADALSGLKSVLTASAPTTPFIVILPDTKAAAALEAMTAGAYECLPPLPSRFQVLAAAKRAAVANGRTLFGAKVRKDKIPWTRMTICLILSALLTNAALSRWNGPPPATLNLASATLSGIQWDDRSLWVGNWFDSTVTHYAAAKGLFTKQRVLVSDEIFKMQDSQPILVCNTPESLVTLGFDLKLRTHQRAVGLPTLQAAAAPATNPTGLAWDGENIWSIDGQTGLLYKHGADLRVLDSVKSLIPSPTGLAWDGRGFWIVGGTPFRAARLERRGAAYIWQGPYKVNNFLPPEVAPTGVAVGFGRLWVVSGGTPHMISRPLNEISSQLDGWK